ncbi:hypothetical protein [Halomarina ordinaria]|uniref:Uncharacterized protein n=1 Tax=Halomarina ordinaria TaxID=3033939 RepID=A0ABD5UC92_9EURY|nr:hypothetical protein [Halomarina sp. PSRA2]
MNPKRLLAALFLTVAVLFGVHYALFGALPLGKPQVLDEEGVDTDTVDADASA